MPNARLLTAARAGHMLPLERPRLINDALVAMAAGFVPARVDTPTLVPA
jgi:pimeloyl-ACP methyl ester carboxylesterase